MLTVPPMATLVPHAGAMCLLDRLLSHDADAILCAATSHRDPANPLRRGGVLPGICGVEYAAQAMAAHRALTEPATLSPAEGLDAAEATVREGPRRPGYLASLRRVRLGADRLDDVADDLCVAARALSRDATGFIYEFVVSAGDRDLLTGQIAIIIPAGAA